MSELRAETGAADPEFARQVAAAIDQIRPALQADGGDIELVSVIGQNARVRLVGACVG